jgi:hypothetical protein
MHYYLRTEAAGEPENWSILSVTMSRAYTLGERTR